MEFAQVKSPSKWVRNFSTLPDFSAYDRQLTWTKSHESDIAIHFKTLEMLEHDQSNEKSKEKETALFALQKEMEAKMMIIEQLETKLCEVTE